MSGHYTLNWSCKPCKLPRLPPGTEEIHITSGAHLKNTLKHTSTKTSIQTWTCIPCNFTLPAHRRDTHEASKRHNAMKRRGAVRIQLIPAAAADMKGEEVGDQTPPASRKKMKKGGTKNARNVSVETPVSVPISIPPKKRPKPRQSAPTKSGCGKRDRTTHHESQNSAQTKVARNVINSPASTVERTVVNGAPVIRIISAMPAPARIAVPKINQPPVERSWRTLYSERQERYGYAYPFKQAWWTCPRCKCTMYETCKGAHELKKCKPMELVEFVPAPPRRIKARIMPVDVSRGLQKIYDSEERAAQKERYLRRADARDKSYRYRNVIPTQILSTPGVQIGMWSRRREMRRRREAEIMGREVEDREREARNAEARKRREKERREKERKDRERRERGMRAQQMRDEMKPQGRNGKKSRGNNSRGNSSRDNNSRGNNSRGNSSRGDNSRGRGNRRRKARGQGGA